MSINNTNRDIRRFETDGDGNTTRVLLNTDEPLGLVEGDLQAQIDVLRERLNSIVGLDNVVKITHGGTGQTGTVAAMEALTTNLGTTMFESNSAKFLLKRVDGNVVLQTIEEVIDILDGLKASNNLSDLSNTLTGLQNLYHDVPEAETEGGVPLKNWFDSMRVMLGHKDGNSDYVIEPNYYELKDLVDNYLSEYFLMKSNNLSELSSVNDAIKNLLSDAQSLSTEIAGGDEIMLNNAGTPSPRAGGKITILQLFNYILNGLNTEYGMTKDSQTNLYEFTGNAATADLSNATEQTLLNYDGQPGGRKELTLYNKFTQNMSIYSNISSGTITIDLDYGATGDKRVILVGVCPEITNGYGDVIIKSYDITHSKDSSDNLSNELTITYDATIGGASMAIRFNAIYYVAERIN